VEADSIAAVSTALWRHVDVATLAAALDAMAPAAAAFWSAGRPGAPAR
jgi:hypothetical protein